jgi:hypothetical protein
MIYAFIAVFLFEALTNWRVPIIVSRLRYGANAAGSKPVAPNSPRFGFEAERMLRITVAALLGVSFIMYPNILWFVPWFVAVMLSLAGITAICPMVIFYRFCGFR